MCMSVYERRAHVCPPAWLQGLHESLRGVRRGLPGCQDRAGNTPWIYLHLIPKERSGPCSWKKNEDSSLVWAKTPAIHLLLRTSALKEARRDPKNMCVVGKLFVCVHFIIKSQNHMCVRMDIVPRHECAFQREKKARFDESQPTVQITFMTLLYHPEFAGASLPFASNHVTFYSNLTDVQVMMPPTSAASQSTAPAFSKAANTTWGLW